MGHWDLSLKRIKTEIDADSNPLIGVSSALPVAQATNRSVKRESRTASRITREGVTASTNRPKKVRSPA